MPATDILGGKAKFREMISSILMLNLEFLAFLARDGSPLPDPKSLSATASRMLSTERKDVK